MLLQIELDKVELNSNVRNNYKDADLNELMGSLRDHGQLEPIGVTRLANGNYDLIFGFRRFLAAQKLGWGFINAVEMEVTDETHRDVLNLVENIQRKNTTAAEDGRILSLLKKRGLTEKEIAARVGISLDRVRTTLDVYRNFPDEFKQVSLQTSGRTNGISPTMVSQVVHLQRRHGLNKRTTRKILEAAQAGEVNGAHLTRVAFLVKAGMDTQTAFKKAKSLKLVTVQVFIKESRAKNLEREYGKSIHMILTEVLLAQKQFGLKKRGARPKQLKHRKERSFLRQKEAQLAS